MARNINTVNNPQRARRISSGHNQADSLADSLPCLGLMAQLRLSSDCLGPKMELEFNRTDFVPDFNGYLIAKVLDY